MSLSEMVIKSKLIAPRQLKNHFHRTRLEEKFKASLDQSLTVIHAGTGYGKTTALITLSSLYPQVFWYTLTEPDRDPTLFLAHLISAFQPTTSRLVAQLEEDGFSVSSSIFTRLLNQLTQELEEDTLFVLDDYHLVCDVPDIARWMEQLIENHPPLLHVAIATRNIPETPAFIRWRVKGTLSILDQEDLAFDQEEIAELYAQHYGFPISKDQAESIYSYTDGWVIALQMIWQRLQTSPTRQLDQILSELPKSFSEVFYFLANEVLMRQPKGLQTFLISTAVLRQLDAKSCDALLDISNSAVILQDLLDRGLFTFFVDNTSYRYQRLFQDFLLEQGAKNPEKMLALHKKAARYFADNDLPEEAIYHLFACDEQAAAAELIIQTAPRLLETGRLRTVAKWIQNVDPHILDLHPQLWLIAGDVHRLRSTFDLAISAYQQAERIYRTRQDRLGHSQALRGQAQVYLDTIRPLKASSLVEEAISLLEPQEHPAEVAALLDQLAENKLNLGKPQEAQALHREANMLRSESDPDAIYLEARALLRTGRLQEAINLYEPSQKGGENSETESRPQRFHREMPLLLSLIHLMLGHTEKGEKFARVGIETGRKLDSPFVEAVGWMRLGHANQLYPHLPWRAKRLQEAAECYQRSIELVRPFNVVRVQVEPLWGLCRFHGYQGNLAEAERLAGQAIEIADGAGDQWLVGLLQCTMGTAYALAGKYQDALEWLSRSNDKFEEVGDIFGASASCCARVYNEWYNGNPETAITRLKTLLPQLKKRQTAFLLTRPTHLGMQDTQPFVPILIEAYKRGIEPEWLQALIPDLDFTQVNFHPGYSLAVVSLGKFEVWRGGNLTNPRDWQREKARQLFQFLVSNKGKWFTREQLTDRLWPDLDIDASAQNLKVALNALNRALEPAREPGQNPFFILRRDASYGMNPAASLYLDVDDFLALTTSNDVFDLQQALEIYHGDFMTDVDSGDWFIEKRENLRENYLLAANRLADYLLANSQCNEAMKVCHEILSIDPCNEPAFRLLMRCNAESGNLAAVHAVYQRCVNILKDDLDVPPSSETTQLYQQLTK